MVPGIALLGELTDAGFALVAEGERLIVAPAARITPATREAIRVHKRDLLAALLMERLRDTYAERAAIAEFDGSQSRGEAELIAFETVLALWMNEDANAPPTSPSGLCAACGAPLGNDALPVLRPGGGHTWLHGRCTAPWLRQRRAAGAVALTDAGIPRPANWKQ